MTDNGSNVFHEEPRLATLVAERLGAVAALSYSELRTWPAESSIEIAIDGRSGAITVFVSDYQDDGLLVVVHGFVDRAVPRAFSPTVVEVDGFWRRPDGSMTPATPWDLDEYE